MATLTLLCSFTSAESEHLVQPNSDNQRHNPFPVQAPYAGIYSHAVETHLPGRYLHISGQLGIDASGLLAASFKDQAKQAIKNVSSVLKSADMKMADVVHIRFLLTDPAQINELVEVRKAMLQGLAPAVTTYVVGGLLNEEWKIEVEAVAFQKHARQ